MITAEAVHHASVTADIWALIIVLVAAVLFVRAYIWIVRYRSNGQDMNTILREEIDEKRAAKNSSDDGDGEAA